MSTSPLTTPLVRRLSKYVAAAVAATGAAEAKADIIYTNFTSNPFTAATTGQAVFVDLVNQKAKVQASITAFGSYQFRISNRGAAAGVYISGNPAQGGNKAWVVTPGLQVQKMASGALIPGANSFRGDSNNSYRKFAGNGVWTPGTNRGFVGVRFLVGGATRFGWIDVQDTSSSATPTIFRFAYNNTAGGLTAGQTTPEPGAVLLSLLAFGSAGLVEYRRRRNNKTAPESETAEPIPAI